VPDDAAVARFDDALTRLAPDARRIGLAVSGGPDSVALLLLAHAARPGRVAAATVDHGLRVEARAEAAFVAGLCDALGVPHVTLRVSITADGHGVQAAARGARYAALADWCAGEGIDILATAHHLDDQAETLLMRLARGAGVAGLAGVREARPLHRRPGAGRGDGEGVGLIRPLLAWRKDDLAAIVAAAGIAPVDDPSNRDPRYDRTSVRALLAMGAFDPARLAASAAHLAEAEVALDWAAAQAWDQRVAETGDAIVIDPTALPEELKRRLLARALAHFAGPAPSGPELARLKDRLNAGGSANLAGVLARGGRSWRLSAEPPRR
jgi:tRNA(Ile)-lysidine synthase